MMLTEVAVRGKLSFVDFTNSDTVVNMLLLIGQVRVFSSLVCRHIVGKSARVFIKEYCDSTLSIHYYHSIVLSPNLFKLDGMACDDKALILYLLALRISADYYGGKVGD